MEIAQSLLLAILSAAIERKSILISCARLDKSIAATQLAISSLFNKPRSPVIKCEKWTNWQQLENDLTHAARVSNYILVANPGSLDMATQAYLTELLQSGRYLIFFMGPSNGMRRILRSALFFQLNLTIDSDSELVGIPQSQQDIEHRLPEFRQKALAVYLSSDIRRYAQDLVVFVRTHRFVAKGVPPRAAFELEKLMRILCVFSSLEFATPSIVTAAIRLLIPLHIELIDPSDDISLEYGGDLDVITTWLNNWDTHVLVDTVIDSVPCPL